MKSPKFTFPINLRKYTHAHLISLGLGSSLLFGCFDPAESGSETPAEPITHEVAHELLSANIQSMSSSLESRLRFLDGDERLMEAFNSIFAVEEESCYFDYDENGNEIETCESFEDEENGDDQIRIDFMEGTEDMISAILEELPQDLQIQEEEQLTYRLNVNRLCETTVEDEWDEEWNEDEWSEDEYYAEEAPNEEDWDGEELPEMESYDSEGDSLDEQELETEIDQDCLRIMQEEEPRVRLQAAGDGIKVELLLNQGQDILATATLNSDLARVSLDLGTLTRIIESIDSNVEEGSDDFDLELSGAISLEMDTSIENKAIFRANVDKAISVVGRVEGLEEINFTFPAARDVFSVTSDSEEPALNLALAIPKLVQSLQTSLTSEYEYDEETGEDILVEEGPLREIVATLGGLNLGFNLKLVDEGVSTTMEVGLGQDSSSIAIDGNEVIKVDINPNHGRLISFNFDHSTASENLLLTLASELHALNVELNLGLVPEIEAPLGFADELYKVAFTSLNNELPSLVLGGEDSFIQVLTGQLDIVAERGEISHSAEGGMCINPIEDDEENFSEDFSEEEYVEDEPEHPLAMLEVAACGVDAE